MNNYSRRRSGQAARRQEVILQLVRGGGVRSQGELARLLRRRGIAVAQPTLSRDVRELRLAKTPDGYTARDGPGSAPADARGEPPGKLGRTLRSFVLSVRAAGSLVVIKTPPAAAQPVARALDEVPPRDVVGTIAGDDTVFVATPSEQAARALGRRLAALATVPERKLPA
jgi:transcriptional regulator of arginine metabolism